MRVLVIGANGTLGPYVVRALMGRCEVAAWSGEARGQVEGASMEPVDLTDSAATRRAFERTAADVVANLAAVAKPAEAARQPERTQALNVEAVEHLAALCAARCVRLVYTSSDMVFDGEQADDSPGYNENDPPNPQTLYGRSKVASEGAVLASDHAVVLRLSLLYGPGRGGVTTFFDQQVAAMRSGDPVRLFEDEWRTPLALDTAGEAVASACLATASEAQGLFHVGGPQRLNRLEMGRILAEQLGIDSPNIEACSRLSIDASEPRPRDLSVDARRWRATFDPVPWPSYRRSVRQFLRGV